jgi:superfamily II DNA or RNA helicase
MQLRKYQERTKLAVFKAWKEKKRVVAVLPTGAGKTVTGADIVKHAVAKGHQVVWVAHRTELLSQAKATIEKICACPVGIISPNHKPLPSAPVQVASIQTLLARKMSVPAKLLVVDECHHMAEDAPEWVKITKHYEDSYWLGLTATPERGNGTGLAPLWETLVAGAQYAELITLGKILPCRVLRPVSTDTTALAARPVDAYQKHAMGSQAVVYASSVAEAEKMAQDFVAEGIAADFVTGDTPDDKRKKILEHFSSSKIQVVVNVYVLTEGWDAPCAQTCILARGCGSPGTFIQMVGRVMRPDPNNPAKTECLLVDLVGMSEAHGHPQADRVYSLEGTAIELAEKAKTKREAQKEKREKQDKRELEMKAILARGLLEMSPLGVSAKEEWERLQRECQQRAFSVEWAQRRFRDKFGSKPPIGWVSRELRALEYRNLQDLGRERGYRRGWAMFQYKQRFGRWPTGVGR